MKNPNAIMLNTDYLKNMNLQKVPTLEFLIKLLTNAFND